MATPGTPSGENHSADSQKCGWNAQPARVELLLQLGDPRFERAAFDRDAQLEIRRSSSFSSGHAAHSSGGMTSRRGSAGRCVDGHDGCSVVAAAQSSSVEAPVRLWYTADARGTGLPRPVVFFTVYSRLLRVRPILCKQAPQPREYFRSGPARIHKERV